MEGACQEYAGISLKGEYPTLKLNLEQIDLLMVVNLLGAWPRFKHLEGIDGFHFPGRMVATQRF